ncbi:MAG: hypothetical protein M3R18_04935 [Pseudomonadota bacterium]|nr:hypothetical protein [Pseudomonadota bacterium]
MLRFLSARLATMVLAVALAAGMTPFQRPLASAQMAQTQVQPTPAPQPSRMQRARTRAQESMAKMKERSAARRAKWKDCRNQARALRLSGKKTREFLDQCLSN